MKGLYLLLTTVLFSSEIFANQNTYSEDELKHLAEIERNVSAIPNVESFLQEKALDPNAKKFALDLKRDNYLTSRAPMSRAPEKAPLPNVLVFTSLGLPELTLKQQLHQSEMYKVPLIIQGILPSGLQPTATKIMDLLGLEKNGSGASHKINSGFAISPDWFEKFNIESVPVIVVIKQGRCQHNEPCERADFDIVRGNVPIPTALEMIAESGDAAETAKQVLLRGNNEGY